MKRLLFFMVALITPLGCTREPERAKTDLERFQVKVLFTDDNGYTVHTFQHEGRTHYYVTPIGETMTHQGKMVGRAMVYTPENIGTAKSFRP